MMCCINCENEETRVIDSRKCEGGNEIRRRRVCEKCGKRFTTKEKVEKEDTMDYENDEKELMKVLIVQFSEKPTDEEWKSISNLINEI